MRKTAFRVVGLLVTLAAMASTAPRLQADPVEPLCPACIIGYKCCIQGNQASCIPQSRPCN